MLTFFVLAGLVFVTSSKKQEVTTTKNDAIYTRQDVDRLVNEALAKQQQQQQQQINDKATTTFAAANPPTANRPAPQKPSNKQSAKQTARNRRPLSRAEREQLAADLRLISIDDDLDLPGDRINQ